MKLNKKVSDLARKLEFIGIDEELKRREIIKSCIGLPGLITGFYLVKKINGSYARLKKEVDNYNKLKYLEQRTQRIIYS